MKRRWIPLDKLEIYDEMHQLQPDGSFWVDEAKDGQSTQVHREGIEYVKNLLDKGLKIRPVLVLDKGGGEYLRLDGFKRCLAYLEKGKTHIEAFVCDHEEYTRIGFVRYHEGEMYAGKGGQPKEIYPILEGGENENDNIHFLYNSPLFRVEWRETIHVHWGEHGKYRIDLGRRDFLALTDIFEKWEE